MVHFVIQFVIRLFCYFIVFALNVLLSLLACMNFSWSYYFVSAFRLLICEQLFFFSMLLEYKNIYLITLITGYIAAQCADTSFNKAAPVCTMFMLWINESYLILLFSLPPARMFWDWSFYVCMCVCVIAKGPDLPPGHLYCIHRSSPRRE